MSSRLKAIFSNRKMLIILGLGAASGYPNQITESALQAWLTDTGRSLTEIGLFTYVSMPYLLKVLWAPAVDRYLPPVWGRRRGWLLITQIALCLSIAALAFLDPSRSLAAVAVVALIIVFFSASQDIVIDAWRTEVSLPAERGLAAAANNLGYRACAWLAFAAALLVAQAMGWRPAFLVLAAAVLVFIAVTALAPEPEQRAPPPASLADSFLQPLRELLGTPGGIGLIVLIITFKIGGALALKLFTPFLMGIGFSKAEIGVVAKAVLTSSAIVGGVLGGLWMVRLGLLRSLLLFGVLQTVTILAFWLLAVTGKSYPLMIFATAIENLTAAMGNIAEVALIMAMCNVRYSAFQYALLSVLALLPRYLLGGPAGWLADHGGWPTYYLVTFMVALPGLVMVWVMRHRIAALDRAPA